MRLTNKIKLEILLKARRAVKEDYNIGMCRAVHDAGSELYPDHFAGWWNASASKYRDYTYKGAAGVVGIFPPEGLTNLYEDFEGDPVFWYPLNKDGQTKRLAQMTQRIKELRK